MAKHAYRDTLGKRFNEGARRLWEELDRRFHGNQAELAKAIGADGASVHRWLYGDQLPGVEAMFEIQQRLRISGRLWREKPTQEFVLPVERIGLRHSDEVGAR